MLTKICNCEENRNKEIEWFAGCTSPSKPIHAHSYSFVKDFYVWIQVHTSYRFSYKIMLFWARYFHNTTFNKYEN